MVKYLLSFLFIILYLSVKSQVSKSDLLNELDDERVDLEQINLNFKLGDIYNDSKNDSAIIYLRRALHLTNNMFNSNHLSMSEKNDVSYLKAKSLHAVGSYFSQKYHVDSAIIYYKYAIDEIDKLKSTVEDDSLIFKYTKSESIYLLNTGVGYYIDGDNVNAISYYNKSIELAKQIDDSLTLSKGLLNLGMVHDRIGKYNDALENYLTTYKVFDKLNDKKGVAICFLSMGNIYRKQLSFNQAINYYKKALDIFIGLEDRTGIKACYNNLGISYISIDNFEKALDYYNKSLIIEKESGNQRGVSTVIANMAIAYFKFEHYEDARRNFFKALEISEKNRYLTEMLNVYSNLASLYNNLAEKDKTNSQAYLDSAIYFGEKSFFLADSAFIPVELLSTSLSLMDSYDMKGDYYDALNKARKAIEIKDTLFDAEKVEVLAEMEARFESDRKEKEIEQKNKEIEIQQSHLKKAGIFRNILISGFLALVVLLVIIFRIERQKHKTNKLLSDKNKLIENQNVEIIKQSETLQSMYEELSDLAQFKEKMTGMIVHDLKTPLNGIINSNFVDDLELREQMIQNLGFEMLNQVENILDVYKSDEKGIHVNTEPVKFVEILEMSLGCFTFIVNEKLIKIEYDKSNGLMFNVDNRLIYRVLSNLLSNAIKFSPDDGAIQIQTQVFNCKDVRISVSNEGPAIPKDKQNLIFDKFGQHELRNIGFNSSTGLGLSFCKLAVEAHGGAIGVISENQGAEFYIYLPDSFIEPQNV